MIPHHTSKNNSNKNSRSSGASPLMMRDISCNQMLQIAEVHFKAGFRLRASFILPVITAQHGGQFESLCDCNCGRWGLELSTEPSLHYYYCALGQYSELKGL